jgi:LysW-gamma-L-lysine carboxypeptidase
MLETTNESRTRATPAQAEGLLHDLVSIHSL